MRPENKQFLRMDKQATQLKCCDQYTRTSILAVALETARHNEHIKDKRQLKLIIRSEVKKRMRKRYEVKKRMRKRYGAVGWVWFLWWVLPKVVEWFIVWYFNDQRLEANRKAELQQLIDQARGEMG